MEHSFVSTLDAVQEYVARQNELSTSLRSGHLNLAKARYAMGADRVSALQLPAHMRARVRLQAAEDGSLELFTPDGAAAAAEAQPQDARRPATPAASPGGGVLEELAAKYDCDFDPSGAAGAAQGGEASAGDPLGWFGAMVSPSLRDAERDFRKVLDAAVALANARRALTLQLNAHRAAAPT